MPEKRICRRVLPGEAELCPLPRGHRWPCDDERSKLTAKFNTERAEHLARVAERDEALCLYERATALAERYGDAIVRIGRVLDDEVAAPAKVSRIRGVLASLAPVDEEQR